MTPTNCLTAQKTIDRNRHFQLKLMEVEIARDGSIYSQQKIKWVSKEFDGRL